MPCADGALRRARGVSQPGGDGAAWVWRGRVQIPGLPAPGRGRAVAAVAVQTGRTGRQSLAATAGADSDVSRNARRLPEALPRRRADPPDPADPQIRAGRLQLPAPGFVRRAGVSAAGDGAAVAAGRGFYRRRVSAGRAAPAAPVEGRSRAVIARRRGG